MTNAAQLITLLYLASPALSMDTFSYSQGLEAAVGVRHVADEVSTATWIAEGLDVLAACETPLWLLQLADWQAGRFDAVAERDAWFLTTRETRELWFEASQMGWSLNCLIQQLEWGDAALHSVLAARAFVIFPTAFAAAAVMLNVDPRSGVAACCFAWVENQVTAAVKAAPLGQAAGQRISFGLHVAVARAVEEAVRRAVSHPPELSTFSSGLGVLSARRETQYSRLFRP